MQLISVLNQVSEIVAADRNAKNRSVLKNMFLVKPLMRYIAHNPNSSVPFKALQGLELKARTFFHGKIGTLKKIRKRATGTRKESIQAAILAISCPH